MADRREDRGKGVRRGKIIRDAKMASGMVRRKISRKDKNRAALDKVKSFWSLLIPAYFAEASSASHFFPNSRRKRKSLLPP
jgi:hypothetical protein